jgi:predicted enzyme related to lactoylglutathione lyase
MIKGVHTMFYTSQTDELRAFLRDKLRFSFSDVGDGWLIFDLPEADMGCHPSDEENGAPSGTHSISFYCDDIEKTVTELTSRGVEFIDGISDAGYGLVTHFRVPGGFALQLYQPRYTKRARPARSTKRAAVRGASVAKRSSKAKAPAKAVRSKSARSKSARPKARPASRSKGRGRKR